MDRRFLQYYEQELRFVRDLAGEFASEHARVASRFGLDQDSCADPYVEWLLDGSAFLAARVQMKLDGEYDRFTHHLLEMVFPEFLAPTPASAIFRFRPDPAAPVQEGGFTVARRQRLTGPAFKGEQTRCVFTTAQPVTLWPIEIAEARYLSGPQLAAKGLARQGAVRAALHIRLRTTGEIPLSALALDRLSLHLAGNDRIAHRLYEALAARVRGIAWQAVGEDPAPPALLPAGGVERQGFAEDEALFLSWPDDPLVVPRDRPEGEGEAAIAAAPRGFSGYRLLREYFTLPQKFLFVALTGLERAVRSAPGREIDLFVLLDAADPMLDGAVTADQLMLFATPAINLFRRRARPILVEPFERDHHVVCDRLRPLDYEVYEVLSVDGAMGAPGTAGGADDRARMPFERFWHTDHRTSPDRERAFHAVERRPRVLSGGERSRGVPRSSYIGSEVYLTLCDGNAAPWPSGLRRLDVEVLCTNRDLPMRLRRLLEEASFTCEAGGPAESAVIVGRLGAPAPSPALADDGSGAPYGQVAWRLVGHLALNHLSLTDGPEGRGPDALRSLLGLYAAHAEPAVARHIEGLRSIRHETVTRRLPASGPIAFGRGLEITLELAESAFQEGSAFLLASVLETFFRRYVSLNSFVETVLRTSERGEVMRWPMRMGMRHLA